MRIMGWEEIIGRAPGRCHDDASSGLMQNLRETEVYQTQRFMMRLCTLKFQEPRLHLKIRGQPRGTSNELEQNGLGEHMSATKELWE